MFSKGCIRIRNAHILTKKNNEKLHCVIWGGGLLNLIYPLECFYLFFIELNSETISRYSLTSYHLYYQYYRGGQTVCKILGLNDFHLYFQVFYFYFQVLFIKDKDCLESNLVPGFSVPLKNLSFRCCMFFKFQYFHT